MMRLLATRPDARAVMLGTGILWTVNALAHVAVRSATTLTDAAWSAGDIVLRVVASAVVAFGLVVVLSDDARLASGRRTAARVVLFCAIPVIAIAAGAQGGTLAVGRVAEALATIVLGATLVAVVTRRRAAGPMMEA